MGDSPMMNGLLPRRKQQEGEGESRHRGEGESVPMRRAVSQEMRIYAKRTEGIQQAARRALATATQIRAQATIGATRLPFLTCHLHINTASSARKRAK